MARVPLAQAVKEISGTFSGQLLQPADPGYEEARRVHNGLIDKRPALIARCLGVADVVDAVRIGRSQGLEVAVRGGGHNAAGRATTDAGLMIDLSLMKGISVNSKSRTARAQGGVTWAELNRETQLHGLATTGGFVSTTGIAGLTLGGGLGWLMGKHGLTIDNLLSVDMVLADGRIVTASKNQNPDLFWAVRGGGGNFGVATYFEYRLHRVGPTITGGLVAHPFGQAKSLLTFFREVAPRLPDELTVFAGLFHAPDGSGTKLAGIVACHCGATRQGEAATRPLKKFGSPAIDIIGPMSYCEMNSMFDASYPKGALNYWKSCFITDLSDEAIDAMIDAFSRCPSPMSGLSMEYFHGTAVRKPVGSTAFPLRTRGYDLLLLTQWKDRSDNERCIAWARETYARMKPFMARSKYVNYLDNDETVDQVAAAYGPNYPRLQRIKKKYDPTNLFHMNQNIRPA